MKVFAVSGNIGAGKSTTGELAAKQAGALWVPEPVELWRSTGALQLAYDGRADIFQPFALASRVFSFQAAVARYTKERGALPELVLVDRWLPDDFAFAKVNLDTLGFEAYKKYFDAAGALQTISVFTIRLAVHPSTCLQRIAARGRSEEANIDLDYLERIDAALPPANAIVFTETVDDTVDAIVRLITQ